MITNLVEACNCCASASSVNTWPRSTSKRNDGLISLSRKLRQIVCNRKNHCNRTHITPVGSICLSVDNAPIKSSSGSLKKKLLHQRRYETVSRHGELPSTSRTSTTGRGCLRAAVLPAPARQDDVDTHLRAPLTPELSSTNRGINTKDRNLHLQLTLRVAAIACIVSCSLVALDLWRMLIAAAIGGPR